MAEFVARWGLLVFLLVLYVWAAWPVVRALFEVASDG